MEGDNNNLTTHLLQMWWKKKHPDMPAPLCTALIWYMGGDTTAQTQLDSTRNTNLKGKQVIWMELLGFLISKQMKADEEDKE